MGFLVMCKNMLVNNVKSQTSFAPHFFNFTYHSNLGFHAGTIVSMNPRLIPHEMNQK